MSHEFESYDDYSEWSDDHDSDNPANSWSKAHQEQQTIGKNVDENRNGEIINE